MRRAVAALGFLVFACGGAGTAQAPEAPASSARTVPSPIASPASTSFPAITPLTSPAAATVDFTCKLPVFWTEPAGTGAVTKVGFVSLPAGEITEDSVRLPATAAQGFGGIYYDRALAGWLPVARQAISPDGMRYAYADYDLPPSPTASRTGGYVLVAGVLATTGRVHVVDGRTGSDRVIYSGSPTFAVRDFSSAGIYLAKVDLTMDGAFSHGLYLMNAATGSYQAVPGADRQVDRSGWNVEGGVGWGTAFAGAGSITSGNSLLRLDLQTGAVAAWLTRPEGQGVQIVVLDRTGSPLVHVFGTYGTNQNPVWPGFELWRLTSPTSATKVWDWTNGQGPAPWSGAVTDSHGTWFGSSDASVWLSSPDAGMRRIATASKEPLSIGGSCV